MSFCRFMLIAVLLTMAACKQGAGVPAATSSVPAPAAQTSPPDSAPIAPTSLTGSSTLRDEDFTVIPDGKPYDPVKGKIEVVEFFNYICPACNAFDPQLQEWKARLPADVNLVYVPADFNPDFITYARVYYAADLLGLAEKTHHAIYQAIHVDHKLPGEGESPDPQKIALFFEQYGVTAQAFMDAMDSFAVNTRMDQGHQFEMQSRIMGTPSLVIDGKYLVKAGSFADRLRITSLLIERERSAGAVAK